MRALTPQSIILRRQHGLLDDKKKNGNVWDAADTMLKQSSKAMKKNKPSQICFKRKATNEAPRQPLQALSGNNTRESSGATTPSSCDTTTPSSQLPGRVTLDDAHQEDLPPSPPLSHGDHGMRCLIEDAMLLSTGAEVAVVLSVMHPLFERLKENVDKNAVRSCFRNRVEYLEFSGTVTHNTWSREILTTKNMSQFIQQIKGSGGLHVTLSGVVGGAPITLLWKDLFDKPSLELQLWTLTKETSNEARQFFERLGRNPLSLLPRLLKEVEGDEIQTNMLHYAVKRRRQEAKQLESKNLQKKLEETTTKLENLDYEELLTDDLFKEINGSGFIDRVDKRYRDAILDLLSTWSDGTAPLLRREVEDGIIEDLKESCPRLYSCFIEVALSKKNRQRAQSEKENTRNKKLQALYSILALCRVKDSDLLGHWAACNTLVEAARATPVESLQTSVDRGSCVNYACAFEKVDKLIEEEAAAIIEKMLESEVTLTVCFDNWQKILSLKSQRNGLASKALHGTTMYVRRNHKVAPPKGSTLVRHDDCDDQEFIVRNVVEVSPYKYLLIVAPVVPDGSVLTMEVEWPSTDWHCTKVEGADPFPDKTYLRQALPRSLLLTKGTSIFSENGTVTDIPMSNEEFQKQLDTAGRLRAMKRHGLPLAVKDKKTPVMMIASESSVNVVDTSIDEIGAQDEPDVVMTVQAESTEATEAVSPDNTETDSTAQVSMDIEEQVSSMDPVQNILKAHRKMLVHVATYETRMVQQMFPHVELPTQLFLLPMSLFDEIKKQGCLQVLVDILIRIRLLLQNVNGSKRDIIANNPNASRRVFTIGDCLTYEHLTRLPIDILNLLTGIGYEGFVSGLNEATKALVRGIGDLHFNMHQVDAVFRGFFGGWMQPCQGVLGWKRIRKDPLPRFQASRRLIKLIYDCLSRKRFNDWKSEVVDAGHVLGTEGENISLDDLGTLPGEEALLLLHASMAAFEKRLGESDDEIVRYLNEFFCLAHDCLAFYDAMRLNDALRMERIISDWATIFAASKKPKYAELCLDATDVMASLPPLLLEEARRNRCMRLNEGRRTVALDEAIEIQNDQQKKYLASTTIEGVQQKSRYLAVSRACKQNQQKNGQLKSSTEPGSIVEYKAIEKFLDLVQPNKSSGRKLDNDFAWKLVDDCKITPTTSKNKKGTTEDHSDSHAAVVAEIFKEMSGNAPASSEESMEGAAPSETEELDLDEEIVQVDETDEEAIKGLQGMKRYAINMQPLQGLENVGRGMITEIIGKRAERLREQEIRRQRVEEIAEAYRDKHASPVLEENLKKFCRGDERDLEPWERFGYYAEES